MTEVGLSERAAEMDEARFVQIGQRDLNLVYSVALREVGDAHLAEDVTQAVFVVLAKKRNSLRAGTLLSGWLFKTTRYCAADALRRQRRRQRYERDAAAMAPVS